MSTIKNMMVTRDLYVGGRYELPAALSKKFYKDLRVVGSEKGFGAESVSACSFAPLVEDIIMSTVPPQSPLQPSVILPPSAMELQMASLLEAQKMLMSALEDERKQRELDN